MKMILDNVLKFIIHVATFNPYNSHNSHPPPQDFHCCRGYQGEPGSYTIGHSPDRSGFFISRLRHITFFLQSANGQQVIQDQIQRGDQEHGNDRSEQDTECQ